jgi:hypothetical protein
VAGEERFRWSYVDDHHVAPAGPLDQFFAGQRLQNVPGDKVIADNSLDLGPLGPGELAQRNDKGRDVIPLWYLPY